MIFNYFMRVIRSNLNNPRKMKMRGCFPRKCSFHRNANYLYFSLILRSKIYSNIFQNNFSLSSMFWNGDGIRWVIWPLIPDYPPHLKFNRYITTIKYFHLKYQFWEKLWTFFPLSNFYCLRSFEHAVFLAWPRVLSHWIHSLSQASFQVAVRGLMRELHTENSSHTYPSLISDEFPTPPLQTSPLTLNLRLIVAFLTMTLVLCYPTESIKMFKYMKQKWLWLISGEKINITGLLASSQNLWEVWRPQDCVTKMNTIKARCKTNLVMRSLLFPLGCGCHCLHWQHHCLWTQDISVRGLFDWAYA